VTVPKPLLTLALALLLGPTQAVSAQAEPEEGPPVVVARIVLSNYKQAIDENRSYRITQSGDVTLGGREMADDAVVADLATLSPFGGPALAIGIDPHAPLPDIVARLALFASKRDLKLLEIESYRTFIERRSLADVDQAGPAFRGAAGRFELPVVVGLAPDGQACEATLAGKAMVDQSFYEEAFNWLDRLVTEEGGAEKTLAKTNGGRDIVVRVQSGPGTPWRCVAGVILAVQWSGWPVVQLEVEQQ